MREPELKIFVDTEVPMSKVDRREGVVGVVKVKSGPSRVIPKEVSRSRRTKTIVVEKCDTEDGSPTITEGQKSIGTELRDGTKWKSRRSRENIG